MQGERCPIWDSHAKGVFFGLSLQSKRSDFNRAIMEGCGYGLRQLCEIAESTSGQTLKQLISVGGGSKSELWVQIKADILGKEIQILEDNDCASIGAALLAGVGAAIYKDPREAAALHEKKVFRHIQNRNTFLTVYEKQYRTYIRLYPQLKELYAFQTS